MQGSHTPLPHAGSEVPVKLVEISRSTSQCGFFMRGQEKNRLILHLSSYVDFVELCRVILVFFCPARRSGQASCDTPVDRIRQNLLHVDHSAALIVAQ